MQRKKERKRARDMDRDHTFDLPDLTEDFWKTVVFAQEDPPSGMGGPGCVCLLSKEGKEYIFGFEETPFYKSTELFPIFETTDERIGYRHKYKAEDHGWKYLEKENALIREDILDEYSKAAAEAKREKENFWHFYAISGLSGILFTCIGFQLNSFSVSFSFSRFFRRSAISRSILSLYRTLPM